MKKSLLALTAVALVSGAAFAGEADPSGQFAQQVQSDTTRAQVTAELLAFKQSGAVSPWSSPRFNQLTGFHSEKTRDQVVAEYLNDRNEANAMVAEDSGSSYLAKLGNGTRDHQYFAGTPVNAQ